MDPIAYWLVVICAVGLVIVIQMMLRIRELDAKAKLRVGQYPETPKREKVRQLGNDAFAILNAYPHSSREHMYRKGMPHRRWNRAWALLKDCDIETRDKNTVELKLMRKVGRMYRNADTMDVLPY